MAWRTASYTASSVAADATAAISAETVTLLYEVNKDDVDTDPFASDEECEGNKLL